MRLILGVCLSVMVVLLGSPFYGLPASSTPSSIYPTKTYQDFGLGFKVQYLSNMTVEKGSLGLPNNVAFYSKGASVDNFLSVDIEVTPADVIFSQGLNTYNLD
jgi:hypothetical protein